MRRKSTLSAGVLAAALAITGCQSTTIVFDDSVMSSDVASASARGYRVVGRDCRWRYLGFGSPELAPTLQGALRNAIDRHPEAMSLVDVVARRETTVSYVVDASCYVVEATALGAEQAAGLGIESEPERGSTSWQDSLADLWSELTTFTY